jgi:hypothetical protein
VAQFSRQQMTNTVSGQVLDNLAGLDGHYDPCPKHRLVWTAGLQNRMDMDGLDVEIQPFAHLW